MITKINSIIIEPNENKQKDSCRISAKVVCTYCDNSTEVTRKYDIMGPDKIEVLSYLFEMIQTDISLEEPNNISILISKKPDMDW